MLPDPRSSFGSCDGFARLGEGMQPMKLTKTLMDLRFEQWAINEAIRYLERLVRPSMQKMRAGERNVTEIGQARKPNWQEAKRADL
jgi:hypothetical protein